MIDQRLGSFNVDLDEVGEYFAIHGLGAPPTDRAHLVYERALPRIREFADELQIPLTLFAIGRDLEHEAIADTLRACVKPQDEIGNHTLSHCYAITRLAPPARTAEILRAAEVIQASTGFSPVGFRAPGYTMNTELATELARQGYQYDSSVFACAQYYFAKATAMSVIRIAGRESASVLGSPRVLTAPVQPYRMGRHCFSRGDGLREVPIGVTPHMRWPIFGTMQSLLAGRAQRPLLWWLQRRMLQLQYINVEMHGIDFLDETDGLEELVRHQPGLRVPWQVKAQAYASTVHVLREAGTRWVTLACLANAALP